MYRFFVYTNISISPGSIPQSRMLGHTVTLGLTFWRSAKVPFHLKFQSYILFIVPALFPEQAKFLALPLSGDGHASRLHLVQSEIKWLIKVPGLCPWFPFLLLHLKSQKLLGSSVVTESSEIWSEDCPHFLHLWKQFYSSSCPLGMGYSSEPPIQKLQARSRCWSLCRNTLQLQGCMSSVLFSPRMRGEEDRIPSL